ncbi:unnamed protein product [Closterium sp. Naga37s-1]|nr:unnamed protein product [Closterium sp. Naga37s-1]CAI5983484.1 unnamed protein product [Closterium sp. NIES-65]
MLSPRSRSRGSGGTTGEGETQWHGDGEGGAGKDGGGAGGGAGSAEAGQPLLINDKRKYVGMWTRVRSSVWMIGGFAVIVYMGHVYIWALIIALQILMTHELFGLATRAIRSRSHQQHAAFRFLNWHFFVTAMVYVYGSFMRKQLMVSFTSDDTRPLHRHVLISFLQYHAIISYSLYIIGFVWFILSLRPGQYKYQFGQFAWTHMILFVVFFQSSFFVANIFQGIIWFLLPCSLIIINDCSAYVFGFFFGRTPLIQLSPKKTWEGFLGASITTVVSAFLLAGFLGQYEWLTCPRKDLSTGPLHCRPDFMFQQQLRTVPLWLRVIAPSGHMLMSPFQRHAVVFAIFASSIAPFGGFFASGFKRAFKIKDFGEMIPGHGGITDRMDCQMVMAVFSFIYYQSFISPHTVTVESLLSQVMSMELEQVQEVYVRTGNYLLGKGVDLSQLHTSDPHLWG